VETTSYSPAPADDGPRRSLPRRLSPSALERYRICPRQFLFADIDRAPRPDEPPSPVLCQGNAVHHALERFYGLPLEDRSLENLHLALRSVWCEHRRRGTFSSREEEKRYGEEALEMLTRYADGYDLELVPLAREQWVETRLEDIQLFGKIDRVDQATGGGLWLVDYKTGRHQLDPAELAEESAVQLYAVAAEASFRQEVERVSIIYLRGGDEVRWTPEREDIATARQRLARLIREIKADRAFEANPGDQCRFCPFALRCPVRQAVSLADLQPVEGMPF
jgi:RecB family exonuclease